MRASTVAAAFIVVLAGLSLAAITQHDNLSRLPETVRAAAASIPTRTPTSTPSTRSDPRLAAAISTTNVYSRPDRSGDLIAVLPRGQRAAVMGRSQAADWLYVAAPPDSGLRGWMPAGALQLDSPTLASLPVVDVPGAVPTPTAPAVVGGLPDPALSEAVLLTGGQLEVRIRNAGGSALTEVMLTLSISHVGGEVIGLFRIGPASLAAGGTANAVPPLAITEPGLYRLELNIGNEPDADRANNVLEVMLTPNGG